MQKKKRKNSKIWKKIIENEKEEEEKKAKDIWNRKKLVIKIEKRIKPKEVPEPASGSDCRQRRRKRDLSWRRMWQHRELLPDHWMQKKIRILKKIKCPEWKE